MIKDVVVPHPILRRNAVVSLSPALGSWAWCVSRAIRTLNLDAGHQSIPPEESGFRNINGFSPRAGHIWRERRSSFPCDGRFSGIGEVSDPTPASGSVDSLARLY
jgi:hypothetical protein